MTVVVEVADERRGAAGVEHPLLDLGDGRGGFGQVDGDAHHLRSRLGQLDALPRGAGGVGRVGAGHRLHDHGRAAADLDAADARVADSDADGAVKPDAAHASLCAMNASIVRRRFRGEIDEGDARDVGELVAIDGRPGMDDACLEGEAFVAEGELQIVLLTLRERDGGGDGHAAGPELQTPELLRRG